MIKRHKKCNRCDVVSILRDVKNFNSLKKCLCNRRLCFHVFLLKGCHYIDKISLCNLSTSDMCVICLKRNSAKVLIWNSESKTRISCFIKLLRNHRLNKRLPRINLTSSISSNNKSWIFKHSFIASKRRNLLHLNHCISDLCTWLNICCRNNNWNEVLSFIKGGKNTKSCYTSKTNTTSQKHFAAIVYTHAYLPTYAGDT